MTRVDSILKAVEDLSPEEQDEFYRRLHHWDDDAWDKQIAEDAASGKLDDLIARTKSDLRSGRLMDMP